MDKRRDLHLPQSAIDRRTALGGILAAGGTAALGGCAWLHPKPLPPHGPPKTPRRLDCHVHVFNGSDLQVAGFLSTSVVNEYPGLGFLRGNLATLIQALVYSLAPKADDELHQLDQVSMAAAGGDRFTSSSAFSSMAERHRRESAGRYHGFLVQLLGNPEVAHQFEQGLAESRANSGLPVVEGPFKQALPPEEQAQQFDRSLGLGLFAYLKSYLNYRYQNLQTALDVFGDGADGIDTFVALLVDFDQVLGGPDNPYTPSSIRDQCLVMSRISTLWAGRLVLLAPYCPLKDAATWKGAGGDSFKNIQAAWNLPGFVGAKMYPPMGFLPFGNEGNSAGGVDTDRALSAFYGECVRRGAVVMAHAGPSMCALPGACEAPGYSGWQQALAHVLARYGQPLRACLGHFGHPFQCGNGGNEPVDWPEHFAALMSKPEGAHLHADLSYASAVLKQACAGKALQRLTSLVRSYPVLLERLGYGSDWLMLGLEPGWVEYRAKLEGMIGGAVDGHRHPERLASMMGGNALRWLNAGAGLLASKNAPWLFPRTP